MRELRAFLWRLKRLRGREHGDGELTVELESHLQMLAEDNVRAGMSPEQAARNARLAFGAAEAVKENCRDRRGFPLLDALWRDFRYSVGTLRRSPGFTAVAVMTLAVGIGVNAAVFTLTNAVLFKGFPLVTGNDRILYISSGYGCCVSWPDFEDWSAQAKSFGEMGVVHGIGITFSDQSGSPERYGATQISSNTFRLVGQRPAIGRDFAPSDETLGAPPVAILSYGFWERRYGKDPAVVGRTVRINGAPTTLIGVMPQGFAFPQNQDLWVPLVPTPDIQKREDRNLWFAFGRMADGVADESARAEMETIGRRLGSAYPLTNQGQNLLPHVQNFQQFFIGPNAVMIYGSMWGAVGFVLLIACANLGNLMLSRAIGRSREVSVRIALGAGRWRIIRQFLIESVMLSGLGGILGWWIAKWGVRAYALANRSWRVLDYTMDYHVLWYLIAISLGAGLLFGLTPALRFSKLDVNATLKDGGRSSTSGGHGKHLSAVLVTGEMALAVLLLAGAGVLIHSFLNLYAADIGVKKATNLLTMQLELPDAGYPRAEAQISFFDRLETRLEAIPGVESVAIADQLPTRSARRLWYEFAGEAPVDEQHRPTLLALTVGPAYFRTLGATVLAGREFNDTDRASAVPVIVVNQRFASQYWPGENPLGKRLRLFDKKNPGAWLSVVGVVSNIVQSTRRESDPLIYVPYRQKPTAGMWVFARTLVPPGDLATGFRREVQAMDADLPIGNPWTLAEWVNWSYLDNGITTALFLVFAAIAFLLASVGLYAVVAHNVSQRTQEIGIRIALGATATDVLRLVFNQGMPPVGIGLTIGLAASFGVNRLLKAELVHVSPSDPITLMIASATLILAAMLGCWIPSRRAMRVDPAESLRRK